MDKAPRAGYIAGIDAARVGLAAMRLGAGRARSTADAAAVRADLLATYTWSDHPVDPGSLILGMVERRAGR